VRLSRRIAAAIPVFTLCFGLAACGGVIQFSDTISVMGPAPVAPPAPPKRVEVTKDHIEIREKILFEIDTANINPASHDLLDEIAKVLTENPQITKVDVIGHTSSEGADPYNQKLSESRAKAVRAYLTSHGIQAKRLSSKGLGEAQPIADNETEEGREKNRRVEFLIVEQGGEK
jgi:OOP family OmpA-OmpF porin